MAGPVESPGRPHQTAITLGLSDHTTWLGNRISWYSDDEQSRGWT